MYGGRAPISSALTHCLVLISMPDVDSFMIVFFVSCIFFVVFLFLAISPPHFQITNTVMMTIITITGISKIKSSIIRPPCPLTSVRFHP